MGSFAWGGRSDGAGQEHRRYHHLIKPTADPDLDSAEFALLGFAVEEGVRRNEGRLGAAQAPDHIRAALANMVPHHTRRLVDLGSISCHDNQLEQAQAELASTVKRLLSQGVTPVVLGGGHEVAFGSFSGLLDFAVSLSASEIYSGPPKMGIINFDAHFDLRHAALPSSGTPFLQASEKCTEAGVPFEYLVLGIAEHSNTEALFDTAQRLGVRWVLDRQLQGLGNQLDATVGQLKEFVAGLDLLYVTVDLDVFPTAVAPGVSAPAARGVPLVVFEVLMAAILDSGKVAVFDVAECNPVFDVDGRTAKLAALLVHEFIRLNKNPVVGS